MRDIRQIHASLQFQLTSVTANDFKSISRLEFATHGEGDESGVIDCVIVATAYHVFCPEMIIRQETN